MDPVSLDSPQILGFVRSFAGGDNGSVAAIPGQASTRRYHRVTTAGRPFSCVVMELPEDDRKLSETSYPFLNLQQYLSRQAFPVPEVYRSNLPAGLIALEDLGDETLEKAVINAPDSPKSQSLYRHALTLIAKLQRLGAEHPDPSCLAFGREFDFKLLRWELDHFREWLLEEGRQVRLTDTEREIVDHHFDRIAQELSQSPRVLVHRDFQSRNLMVIPEKSGPALRVIDFQDALLGPYVYDLVALLRDSYVALPLAQVIEFVDDFANLVGADGTATRRLFHLQTVQRKLKDAGRFVFIDRRRGNPDFLPSIPLSLRYVGQAFAQLPELEPLWRVLRTHVPELT